MTGRRTVLLAGAAALTGCKPRGGIRAEAGAVTVYVSLDEPYARPVLDAFERETGTQVRQVYDTEANKSRGLAQRVRAEHRRPRADVFWSSEIMQMLALAQDGLLAPYRPPSAEGIPAQFRDPSDRWTGFAARMRVLVHHRERCPKPPLSLLDLNDPAWRGEVAMANPLFGTTTTEAVALFQVLGAERARSYYHKRKENETRIVDGNSVAAERVARGDSLLAQTDTDDAFIRADRGRPLGIVYPDQKGIGTLLIPNTAGLIANGPNAAAGRRFLDFLLRPETELILAGLPSRQLPLHQGLQDRLPSAVRPQAEMKRMEVDYSRLTRDYPAVDAFLRQTFLG